LGTDNDISIGYDSAADAYVLKDEANSTRFLSAYKGSRLDSHKTHRFLTGKTEMSDRLHAILGTGFYETDPVGWKTVFTFKHNGGVNKHIAGYVTVLAFNDGTGGGQRDAAEFLQLGDYDDNWGTTGDTLYTEANNTYRVVVDDSDNLLAHLQVNMDQSFPTGFAKMDHRGKGVNGTVTY